MLSISFLYGGNSNPKTNVDPTTLYVAEAFVDEGPTMKRIRPRAQGRAYAIMKRTYTKKITISG